MKNAVFSLIGSKARTSKARRGWKTAWRFINDPTAPAPQMPVLPIATNIVLEFMQIG